MPAPVTAPRISTRYLHWLHDYVRQAGIDPVPVLGALPPAGQPFLPIHDWRTQLDRAAALLQDDWLGLHFGKTIGPQRFGVPGYLLYHCDHFGQALQRLQHFRMLFFHLQRSSLRFDGGDAIRGWLWDGTAHFQEEIFGLAAALQFSRLITGTPMKPVAVGLMCAEPADAMPLHEFCGGEVHFNQPECWIRQSLSVLALPTAQPDAMTRAQLEAQAEQMLGALPDQDALLRDVRRQIVALLPRGEPVLARVAEGLQVSERTLHRRLNERGTGFREVLEQARRQLAESYLRDPQLALADIALLLGYAEQSPFTHAFRRWTGETPSRWRKREGGHRNGPG